MRSILRLGALLALALLPIAPASAQSAFDDGTVSGRADVLAKDLTAHTLLLEGDRLCSVTPATRIVNFEGQRIGLAQVPTAEPANGGGYRLTGSELVEYEGVQRGEGLELTSVRLAVPQAR